MMSSLSVPCDSCFGLSEQRRVRAGRRASLRRSPLALRLPSVPWRLQAPGRVPGEEQSAGTVLRPGTLHRSRGPSPNSLRSLRSLCSNMRRQVSSRSALRARATTPVLLSAEEAPSDLPERTFAAPAFVFAGKTTTGSARSGRYPAGAISGATSSAGLAAPRAARSSTDSSALSERSEPQASEVSLPTGPQDRAAQCSRLYPADRPSMSPRRVPAAASRAAACSIGPLQGAASRAIPKAANRRSPMK